MSEHTTQLPGGLRNAGDPSLINIAPGTRVGRLVVLDQVGEGGMGRVLSAYDPLLDRRVCLKFLKEDSDPDHAAIQRERMLGEGKTLAQLSHPNILPLYDVGEFEDQVYLVTEFIDGWTLQDWVVEASPSTGQIIDAYRSAGAGLAAAHAADVVHRDFKPDNVMIGRDGRVRVMDFGIASRGVDAAERTDSGRHAGTPRYMAPEQLDGEVANAASDQYAFCFALATSLGADIDGLRRDPPALSNISTSEHVLKALRRGLSASPGQRYDDMLQLLAALKPPVHARWLPLSLTALLVIGVGATLWYQNQQPAPCVGSEERLARNWNPSVTGQVRQAFAASGSPVAAQSLSLVTASMDRFGQDWIQSRTQACEATVVHHEQSQTLLDRRMLCFDRRLRERDAVLTLFLGADAKTVAESGDILSTIEPVSRCDDLEAMSSLRAEPVAAADREAYAQIDSQLALAEAQFEAGRYEIAFYTAQTASNAAQQLANPTLVTRAHYTLGMTAEAQDQLDQSDAELQAAFRGAINGGDDLLAARALGRLLFIASSRRVDVEQVQRWLDWKLSLQPWFAHDPLTTAMLDQEHGLALEPLGRLPEAEVLLLRSRDALIASKGAKAPAALRARGNYAGVLLMQGRMAAGAAELEALLPDYRDTMGEQHANLAILLGNLAVAYQSTGQQDRALELERNAIRIIESNLGSSHSDVGKHYVSLAESLLNLDRPEDALVEARHAMTIFRDSLGDGHAWYLAAAHPLARAQLALGRAEQAIETLDKAAATAAIDSLLPYQQANLHLLRARILAELHRPGPAQESLDAAAVLIPSLEELQQSMQDEWDEIAGLLAASVD